MQIVKTVAIAGNVPQEKWNKLTEDVDAFCKDQGIVVIRKRSDDKGNDRYLELVLEEEDAKKVKDFVGKKLLNQI